MLLGSGRASIESTQTPVDTTVIATTNIEEMTRLEQQITSSKLLDRIDEIPVNYLLDAQSEMDILRRDMANIGEKYDVDPNLLRIATYFSVLTRLLPPKKVPQLASWSEAPLGEEELLLLDRPRAEDGRLLGAAGRSDGNEIIS
jgi:predicted Ser/Thr protein kinase